MSSLLYIIAVVLLIAWLIGIIGFSASGLIHFLLLFSIVSLLLRLGASRRSDA